MRQSIFQEGLQQMKTYHKIPKVISHYLKNFTLSDSIIGRLNDHILKYQNIEGNFLYLKYGSGISKEDIKTEFCILSWLQNKIQVSQVVEYHEKNNISYLLTQGLSGIPAYKVKKNKTKQRIKVIALALKKFHSVSINECPVDNSLTKDLEQIRKYIELDVIDDKKFLVYSKGKSIKSVFNILEKQKKNMHNNTFIHGDFCLPNLLIDSNNDFSFIDLGDAGVGDKYKDLSSIEGSISRNFGEKWLQFFYDEYDSSLEIDKQKIQYFKYIDYFDYCLDIKKYNSLVDTLS